MNESSDHRDWEQVAPYQPPSPIGCEAAEGSARRQGSGRGWGMAAGAIAFTVFAFSGIASFSANRSPSNDAGQRGSPRPGASWGEMELNAFVQQYGARHRGGAHVLLDDGTVEFLQPSNSISDSPTSAETSSPYGLWVGLGTRADSGE